MKTLLLIFFVLIVCAFLCIGQRRNVLDFSKASSRQLQGIMALIVVINHFSFKVLDDYAMRQFFEWGMVAVACFLFISGYGLMKSYQLKGNDYLCGFFRRRFLPIALTYLLAACVWTVIEVCLKHNNFEHLFARLCDGVLPVRFSWYVYVQLMLYVAFFLSVRVSSYIFNKVYNKPSYALGGVIVLLSIACVAHIVAMQLIGFSFHWYITIFSFVAGCIIAVYETKVTTLLKRYGVLVTFAIIALIILLSTSWGYYGSNTYVRNALYAVSFYTIYRLREWPYSGFLDFCGRHSLEIYLVHGLIFDLYDYYPYGDVSRLLVLYAGTIFGAWLLKKTYNKVSSIFI